MSTITTAAREYASRPADERFPSVDALIQNAQHDRETNKERAYNCKDLRIVPTTPADLQHPASSPTAPDQITTLALESPKGRALFSHWSFGQLCRTLGAPAGYLRELPPSIAADALNFGLKETQPGTAANLLVRPPNGNPFPTVRAVTSDTYGRVWDAELYGRIQSTIMRYDDRWQTPPTWTGEPAGAYRGDRDSFLIVTNGGSIVNDPSASSSNGQMFRGLLVRNSEVGASSVQIERILFRYVCGNHMLWGAVVDAKFRRRHVGANALRDTISEIGRIAREWTHASAARDEQIIRMLIDTEIAHTKDAVIDELRKIGFSKEQAETAYARCEQHESSSPRSYWGIAQGATRASQDSGYQDDRYILDQLAAKVLQRGAQRVRV
jgi:hypothetical protein